MDEQSESKLSTQSKTLRKTRRGYGRKNKKVNRPNNVKLSVFGSNINGVSSKMNSLKDNIGIFKPSIITLQETKVRKKGLVKLPGYQVYEWVRTENIGGGLMTAIDEKIDSVVITDDCSNSEILTIQIKVENLDIRIINAYGPQEDYSDEKVFSFGKASKMRSYLLQIITVLLSVSWMLMQKLDMP